MVVRAKLLSITKLQNLKAIHNEKLSKQRYRIVVVNHKTTKFESNSQLRVPLYLSLAMLLSITKLQNLKAIYNWINSLFKSWWVVVNHKTTKFESNSQPLSVSIPNSLSCCQSQNYKIWKQFTTPCQSVEAC